MISLRLVIDTNVVVSAAIQPYGLQRAILNLALAKPARLYVSDPVMREYDEVMRRPRLRIREGIRRQVLQLIENRAYRIKPKCALSVTTDPDDNIFVECADAARADYLITGNILDFPTYWKRTKIITSQEFMTIIAPHLLH